MNRSKNPYEGSGVPAENWKRGYNMLRFIGNRNSDAYRFYQEGAKAREKDRKNR
jgi:hypothetical protein